MVTKVNVNMLPVGTGAFQVVQLNASAKLPALDASNLINIPAGSISGFDITSPASGDVLHYNGTNFVNAQPGSTSGVQAWSANLDTLSGLSSGNTNFIVGNGTNWVVENGDTARHSLSLGTADSPMFTGISIGNNSAKVTSSSVILRNTTTNATSTELFLDGVSSRIVLQDNSAFGFDIIIVGRRTDATGEVGKFVIDGAIARDSGASSVYMIGDDQINSDSIDVAWAVTVDADTSNGSLRIKVQGEAGKTVKWIAYVRYAEVIN